MLNAPSSSPVGKCTHTHTRKKPDLQLVLENRYLLSTCWSKLTPSGREPQGYAHGQLQVSDAHGHDADPARGQAAQGRSQALPVVLRGKATKSVGTATAGPPSPPRPRQGERLQDGGACSSFQHGLGGSLTSPEGRQGGARGGCWWAVSQHPRDAQDPGGWLTQHPLSCW